MPTRDEPNKTAIYATALTAFFAIAGIGVVDPILPVIGAEIGATTWQIELLFTAYVAVMAIFMIPVTISTGRFGYKKVLVAGVSVVAVAAILASLVGSIGSLAALRGLWGLGNSMFFVTAMVLLIALAKDREWVWSCTRPASAWASPSARSSAGCWARSRGACPSSPAASS